jgi:hypothetical protein
MGTTVTNQHFIHEEMMSRLNSGNARYRSVPNLLSIHLLCRNLQIKTHKTMSLCILYGCETWSVALREEHRLRTFENCVLRTFGPMREEMAGG